MSWEPIAFVVAVDVLVAGVVGVVWKHIYGGPRR